MKRRNIVYWTERSENGEWFAVRPTTSGRELNFWHITAEHTYLYTFKNNDVYNKDIVWTEELCQELVKELKLNNPNIFVTRFAVDGVCYLNTNHSKEDEMPKPPKKMEGWEVHLQRARRNAKRAAIEKEKGAVPAPFILYAKHRERCATEKEYAWWLTPDKPKRQNIQPGDVVLAWTKFGWKKVTVTRIEKTEEQEKPLYRVKRKIEEHENCCL